MTQKTTLIDYVATFVVALIVLSIFGAMDRAEKEQSAKVLAEATAQARAEHKTQKDRKYAELDARTRNMTGFDQIAKAEK